MSKHNGLNVDRRRRKQFFGLFILCSWPDEEMMDPLVQRTSGLSQRIPPARRRLSRNNIAGAPLSNHRSSTTNTHRHTHTDTQTRTRRYIMWWACVSECASCCIKRLYRRDRAYLVWEYFTCKNTLYPSFIHIYIYIYMYVYAHTWVCVPHPFDNNSRGPVTREKKVIHPIFVLLYYYILYVFYFIFCWTPCSATSTQNGVKQWHILIFHISHTGPLKTGRWLRADFGGGQNAVQIQFYNRRHTYSSVRCINTI
jgi:hypothetical protein